MVFVSSRMANNQVVPFEINTTVIQDNNQQYYPTEIEQNILPATSNYLPSPPKYDSNSTYASKYNRAVYFFNQVSSSSRHKKRMFGSLFYLVHRYPSILFFCLSVMAIILSLWIQALMTIPILIGGLYLIISIYNFIIFIYNGSLLDDRHLINDSYFGKFGQQTKLSDINFEDRWIYIQVNQERFANELGPHLQALNTLQEFHREQKQSAFFVLFYSYHYIEKYTQFPKEIIWQGILSILILAVGIVIPILFQCAWSKQPEKNNQICYMK
jgi:hypothetical protein